MELTDSQLLYFVNNRLKLPQGKRKEYLDQVDHLIDRFRSAADGDGVIDIKKFLKTGSLRKGTVLRPKGDCGVDADVAVFLNAHGATQFDLANLHGRIRKLLVKIYPTKKPEDFAIQPRTLGIEFRESGLEMDLVPLLVIDGPGDYGWQPSSRGEPPVKTSVTKQLEFIRARKNDYANFTALIRLLKYWRNFQELGDGLRSFAIELIVSHLQDEEGVPDDLEEGLLRFSGTSPSPSLRPPFRSRNAARRHPGRRTESLSSIRATSRITSRAGSPIRTARRLSASAGKRGKR